MEYLPPGRSLERSRDLLHGAIDIHVHAGPHLPSSPRRVDPFEAAIEAREAGMRAIVLMDVFALSTGTAWLVERMVDGIKVFGGIILNTVHGGMNPRAVKTALAYGNGAKFVSFGAHSTRYQAGREGRVVDGTFRSLAELYPEFARDELPMTIEIPDESPSRQLDQILSLIAKHEDVYLNTGHVSNDEAKRLVRFAADYGIKHVLVASSVTKNLTIEEQIELADQGAYLEHTLAAFTHSTPIPKTHYYVERDYVSIDEGMQTGPGGGVRTVAEHIQAVGAEHCIVATDFGVYTLPTPVEGLREFIASLLDLGLSEDEIRMVTATNPARLLGLS